MYLQQLQMVMTGSMGPTWLMVPVAWGIALAAWFGITWAAPLIADRAVAWLSGLD